MGQPVRMASIADITKFQELQSRLLVLEQALSSLKEAVLVCTASHDNQLVISRCNEAYTDVFGFKADMVTGRPLTDFVTENMREQYQRKVSELVKQETGEIMEAKHLCACGSKTLWMQSVFIPVKPVTPDTAADARPLHWLVMQRDISEKKSVEQRQKALTEEVLQNNKELQQFSYITSHNLRAPLANLTSLLHLYNREQPADPFNLVILENFDKAVNNLNVTLNDLHRALVIRNNFNVQKEKISLADIFQRVVDSLQMQISGADAKIEADFSGADQILANRIYVQSIFLNLLINSINYRSPKRDLIINVSTTPQEDFILLRFADNGMGIDLNRYGSRMFGLYQRFHTRTDGKGLGLFLVKSQINGLGGRIEVESEVDRGTTFYLYFKNTSQ